MYRFTTLTLCQDVNLNPLNLSKNNTLTQKRVYARSNGLIISALNLRLRDREFKFGENVFLVSKLEILPSHISNTKDRV